MADPIRIDKDATRVTFSLKNGREPFVHVQKGRVNKPSNIASQTQAFSLLVESGTPTIDMVALGTGASLALETRAGATATVDHAKSGLIPLSVSGKGEAHIITPVIVLPVLNATKPAGAKKTPQPVLIAHSAEENAIAPVMIFDKNNTVTITSMVRISDGKEPGSLILEKEVLGNKLDQKGKMTTLMSVAAGAKADLVDDKGNVIFSVDATKSLKENQEALEAVQDKMLDKIKGKVKAKINATIELKKLPQREDKVAMTVDAKTAQELASSGMVLTADSPNGTQLAEVANGQQKNAGGPAPDLSKTYLG